MVLQCESELAHVRERFDVPELVRGLLPRPSKQDRDERGRVSPRRGLDVADPGGGGGGRGTAGERCVWATEGGVWVTGWVFRYI